MRRISIRQFAAAVLILATLSILSACAKEPVSTSQTPQVDTSPENTGINSEPTVTNNILIAYFSVAENSDVDAISSASVRVVGGEAKGHIRVLADVIQSNVGGEIFSILTSTEYPAGVDELLDYASEEQKGKVRPELTANIESLDDYAVVFIGYPNWWYDLPMVMYSFFEKYDFSGKTIVPFCTHNGSRFSSTINTIRELEPEAVVLDGFTTNGNNVENVRDDVGEWISGLSI